MAPRRWGRRAGKPRTVLVIEGGGMKAAYANGVLSSFEEAGHAPWDAVYGTSAGGAMAAWYSAGQARYAEKTWDYAADRRILSYRRALLRRGPILDHDALLEIIYETERPIDQEAVRNAEWPIYVSAVDVHSGSVVYTDLREAPIIPWLKATGRLPFAAGDPVHIEGRDYLDGGIGDPIPVYKAVEDGATDVTLILNTQIGPRRRDNGALARYTARKYPALRQGILHHQELKQAAIHYAEDPPKGVKIRIVRPDHPTGLHRLSRDLNVIHEGLRRGREDGRKFLKSLEE
ncbi:MAG TPA: patatin family protein [Candidatus Thermoplasmatota archaeon]|nr:patatin family protein [Candidatus Thermoplasmatota archaeon]